MNQMYEQKYLKYKAKYLELKNQLKGGNVETTLELHSDIPPYIFKSLGVYNKDTKNYDESTLFPKNIIVTLTNGKFPLNSYLDNYDKSKLTHTIGGKVVKIHGFKDSCHKEDLNKFGNCTINVFE